MQVPIFAGKEGRRSESVDQVFVPGMVVQWGQGPVCILAWGREREGSGADPEGKKPLLFR